MRTFAQRPKPIQQAKPAEAQKASPSPFGHRRDVNAFLHLQRTVGNQAVQRLFQGHALEPIAGRTGTGSTHLDHGLDRIPVSRLKESSLETKQAINEPEHGAEPGADRVAEQAMRVPELRLQPACPCGGSCPQCQRAPGHPLFERLQTKLVQSSDVKNDTPTLTNPETLRAAGQPLDSGLRAFMESRFGQDFGQVRVHTDGAAVHSARTMNSRAYTIGDHIVFDAGEYVPGLPAGRKIIAHELTHVLQQRIGGDRGEAPDSPAMEYEAERAAWVVRLGGGRVTVSHAARLGVALLPRSFRSSLDYSTLSPSEIEIEIHEIRQWLEAHPHNSADRQWLLAALRSLEHRLPGVVAGLPIGRDQFAARFNTEFHTVLHALRPDTPRGELSPDRLAELFTSEQREKLADFMVTRRIPERLFNGADDLGGADAQQRILVSAHIITHGTYRPGSFEQRVHARYCGHWVQIVHQYAGVTPASGGWPEPLPTVIASAAPRRGRQSRGAVMGSFDPMEVPVFGAGRAECIYQSGRASPEELPIPEGTGHARAAEREEARLAEDPTAPRKVHRRTELEMTQFHILRAGDWLYLYTANPSATGQHSVIFSRFVDDEVRYQEGVSYRRAIVFNQPHPESGGREQTILLGEQFVPSRHADRALGLPYRPQIDTITLVVRVPSSARPAANVPELLPSPGGAAPGDWSKRTTSTFGRRAPAPWHGGSRPVDTVAKK